MYTIEYCHVIILNLPIKKVSLHMLVYQGVCIRDMYVHLYMYAYVYIYIPVDVDISWDILI